MSDRATALIAIAAVFGGCLALVLISSGTTGIMIVGASSATALLIVCVINRKKPNVAWVAGMTGVAVVIATAGTTIGGTICSSDGFSDVGQCRDNRPGNSISLDSDWHGWPVPWRTDDVNYGIHGDTGPDVTTEDGTVAPFAVLSLIVWFAIAFAAEGTIIGSWRALRRVYLHHTLFVRA